MIAEVIIQSNVKNLNRIFDYKVPEEYEQRAMQLVGARVLVPFGRMKEPEEGFIVNIKESTEYEVKEIAKIAGGKGGGRPNMAQAGAPDATKIDEALSYASEVIKSQVK